MEKQNRLRKKEGLYGWLILSPLIILMLVFYVFPILHNVYLSMTEYSGLKLQDYQFIFFENYKEIFTEGLSSLAGMFIWTILFAASVTFCSFIFGLMMAVVLEKANMTLSKIYRGIFIIPYVVPAVITILIWRGMLDTENGIINNVIAFFGMARVEWLTDPFIARITVILVMTWLSFPYYMIVGQGIIKSIPRDYYEAANLDGAGSFKCFKKITVPYVVKAIFPVLIMSFIMQFNMFGVYLLTAGGPPAEELGNPGATDLLITYVFGTAFRLYRYNLAAAYSVIIFIFVAAFSLICMRIGNKRMESN